ncbi:MAG: hypothetical protein B7Z80_14485 [Rhodospirillales bacterium 20-64-7]|nr:MAG: hypothetical protein B7Z80_14485 [Rhodospirillales bacterium 20-64-7]
MSYLQMFAASFFVVFLLGLQSKNVVQGRYVASILTSAGISFSQFAFVKFASHGSYDTLAVCTVGGCAGIAFSIWFHQHFIERKKRGQTR